MSKQKKIILLIAAGCVGLAGAAVVGGVLYFRTRLQSPLAQYLEKHGVKIERLIDQPQIAKATDAIGKYIPGVEASARVATNDVPKPVVSPAVFNVITIKGILGGANSAAILSVAGKTATIIAGDVFSVRMPDGTTVVMRCDKISGNLVVLSVPGSDVRKEFLLR